MNQAHPSGRLISRFAGTDTVATPSRRERGTVAQMIHTFGECEIDEELFQLRRQGGVVEIEPKVFDVLAYLLRHRGRVVSKDKLLDVLWPGVTVTESVLPHCVAAVRRAVGDDRARQEVIQTVHGRGYLFVASACSRPAPPMSEDDPAGVAPRIRGAR